jgi:hypothetical protein
MADLIEIFVFKSGKFEIVEVEATDIQSEENPYGFYSGVSPKDELRLQILEDTSGSGVHQFFVDLRNEEDVLLFEESFKGN